MLKYRWNNVISGFDMPIEITVNEENYILFPNKKFKKIKINSDEINVNKNYYVFKKDLKE